MSARARCASSAPRRRRRARPARRGRRRRRRRPRRRRRAGRAGHHRHRQQAGRRARPLRRHRPRARSGNAEIGRFGVRGSDAVLDRLPMLASTSLGPGRDKIYIRGVADSSFNGPSQSIVGQYLGDVRLTFNAPDPDLYLYDVARVEVLEGPQGTLYGTGSLGGILRLVPNPPDLTRRPAAVSAGLLSTRHGASGGDGAFMVNLPLDPGRLALRAVGYGSIDGGYIDDLGQGRRDVNRTRHLWRPRQPALGAGRRLADRGRRRSPSFSPAATANMRCAACRRSPAAPASPSLSTMIISSARSRSARAGAASSWSRPPASSGTAWNPASTRPASPARRARSSMSRMSASPLVTNETRISQPDARGEGWVAGWSLVHDVDRIRRTLGPPAAPLPIAGVRNAVSEAALFGQYSFALGARVTATLGRPPDPVAQCRRGARRARRTGRARPHRFPAVADGGDHLAAGRRAAALCALPAGLPGGRARRRRRGLGGATQRFDSDSLTSVEAGFRLGRAGGAVPSRRRLFLRALGGHPGRPDRRARPSLHHQSGQWPHLRRRGQCIVAVVARIQPRRRRLPQRKRACRTPIRPSPPRRTATCPTSPARARGRARISGPPCRPRSRSRSTASLRYVGRSHLGIGAPIDLIQGGFVEGQTRRPSRFRPVRPLARRRQCRRRARQPFLVRQSVRRRERPADHAAAAAHGPARLRRFILAR